MNPFNELRSRSPAQYTWFIAALERAVRAELDRDGDFDREVDRLRVENAVAEIFEKARSAGLGLPTATLVLLDIGQSGLGPDLRPMTLSFVWHVRPTHRYNTVCCKYLGSTALPSAASKPVDLYACGTSLSARFGDGPNDAWVVDCANLPESITSRDALVLLTIAARVVNKRPELLVERGEYLQ